MDDQTISIDYYIGALVEFLDSIKYDDKNYDDRSELVKDLQYAYSITAAHFAQPIQQETSTVRPEILEAGIRVCVNMVVNAWPKVSPQVKADLSIHYTYTILIDDSKHDPHQEMRHFVDDLVHGRPQKHFWWRLMNDHLPKLLNHYGGFCAFNIFRGTCDFFQGCWIEQHNFHGFLGSHAYPHFLRRLSSLAHNVGGNLFPAEQFDEQALFPEITTAIAQIENVVIYMNDLMSFYKEFDDPDDQTSLTKNCCRVEGVGLKEAFDRLTRGAIDSCKQLLAIFEGRDPQVRATLEAFVQGFATWHLGDRRYRIKEVYERTGDSLVGMKFRQYYEHASSMADIDISEWAKPSLSELVQNSKSSSVCVAQ